MNEKIINSAPAGWNSADQVPTVRERDHDYFWVAVRRKNGRTVSIPAAYANQVALDGDVDLEEVEQYNGARFDPPDENAGHCSVATGWFDIKASSEYDTLFQPLLGADDELIAWRTVADYPQHAEFGEQQGEAL